MYRILCSVRRTRVLPLWMALTACAAGEGPQTTSDPRPQAPTGLVQFARATRASHPPVTSMTLEAARQNGIEVHDLGLVPVRAGDSDEIAFEVLDDDVNLTLVVEGDANAHVVVSDLWRNDAVLISRVPPPGASSLLASFTHGFVGPFLSPVRAWAAPRVGALVVANTPDVVLRPDRYVMRVGHAHVDERVSPPQVQPLELPVRVVALARREVARGHLDLDITLHTQVSSRALSVALDVVNDTFLAANITVTANVTQAHDAGVIGLADDVCAGGELAALLRAASLAATNSVPVHVVEAFACDFVGVDVGDEIGGVTPTVASVPFVTNDANVGVTVSWAFAQGDAAVMGVLLAHELGHFLGLSHSRESNVFGATPIVDNIADSVGSGDDVRDNLMYYANTSSTQLSDGQATVLRRSLWVQPAL